MDELQYALYFGCMCLVVLFVLVWCSDCLAWWTDPSGYEAEQRAFETHVREEQSRVARSELFREKMNYK